MSSPIRSWAAVFAHAHRPVRAVFEYARPGIGCLIENDVIRQIRPPPAARMCGTAACTSRIEVSRFALTAASIASSSTSRARAGGGPPAFATRMSSPPNRSTVAATSRAGASGSVTSAGIARTSPGNSAAVASNVSGLRAQMATRAPSRDIASAAPRPSPFDAAVTSATFPDIPRSIVEMLRRRGSGRRTEARPRRTLVAMSFRRLLPPIAACAAVVALVVTLLSAADGREPGSSTPALRQDPNIAPFQGMGVWIDIYDDAAWADPAAAVADMAAHGVHTLYLETSNFHRPFPFVDKPGVAAFVDAAHEHGVDVVAWYLPGFLDVGLDAKRSKAAIRFRTDAGNGFDGFALDIEAPDVADADVRTDAAAGPLGSAPDVRRR